MTYDETLLVMSVLKVAYPAYYKNITRADAEAAIALWAKMFKDDPFELVSNAVDAHISSDKDGYPPVIGKIKEKVRLLRGDESGLTEQDAWQLVAKALRNSAYNSREEFDRLPADVQRLVGSPNQLREWSQMDSETVQSVVSSNFQRSYRAVSARRNEFNRLPADVRAMLPKFQMEEQQRLAEITQEPKPADLAETRKRLQQYKLERAYGIEATASG